MALRRVLVDPEFVFPQGNRAGQCRPGKNYRISDLELASRLSFFLWSSIPDDELISLASQNKLHEPAVLERRSSACWPIRKSDSAGGQLRRPVAESARLADGSDPGDRSFPISTTTCAPPCARRPSCSSAASSMRIAP